MLMSGGALEDAGEGSGKVNIEMNKRIRSLLPMLSLLGSSYLNQALAGKMCVGHLLPYCVELVEGGFIEPLDGINLRSIYELLPWTHGTRRDDREIASENTQQMIFEYEVFLPGTVLVGDFVLRYPNALESSAFAHLLNLWQEYPTVGAREAQGHGRLRLKLRNPLPESPERYLAFLQENAGEIRALLEELDAIRATVRKAKDADAVSTGLPLDHSDGVLSHLMREAEDADFYSLPSKMVVDMSYKSRSPIAWVYGVEQQDPFPLASVYIPRHVTTTTLYKRFETAHVDLLQVKKKHIDIASGRLRNWVLPFPLCYDPVVEFRLVAVRERLEEMLHHLTHIGKKRVVGYGEVRSIEVERLPSVYDVLFDEQQRLTRPVPLWAVQGDISQEAVFWGVPRPPYWDKRLLQLCIKPGERVKFNEMVRDQLVIYDASAR
jgi:CRISPR type IV-associated protein Csf3